MKLPLMTIGAQNVPGVLESGGVRGTGWRTPGGIRPAFVTFSPNWEAPEDFPVGPKKVERALEQSTGVLRNYVDSSSLKAVVVAGLHATTHDPQPHVTVRLNDANGHHVATYHVYMNGRGQYTGQAQTWP